MLLKTADNKEAEIAELEAQLASANADRKKQLERELRNRRAGQKGEQQAAYLIDFDYRDSQNVIVIHDLRLEINGRVAQIDHLLLNRLLGCYVLETKHFHGGLKITEDGEFLRWNNFDKQYEGMASPLAQNDRHIAVLRDAFAQIEMPKRLGLRLAPTFHSLVLMSPEARIDRPKAFDTSRVIKADTLKKTISDQIDRAGALEIFGGLAKMVSLEVLEEIGRQLLTMHRPKPVAAQVERAPVPTIEATAKVPPRASGPLAAPAASSAQGPICKECGGKAGSILYGKYGYYLKCPGCDGNTSIKVSCGKEGHKERVRKDGNHFYRECADCQSSSLYFTNP